MNAEDLVPSAPLGVNIQHQDGRIFERIRRSNVGSRRCSPCDCSWVAIDRIVHDGGARLLFHPEQPPFDAAALHHDLIDRDLSAVGFAVRHRAGQSGVITDECPGVRLRALVEALRAAGTGLPREAVWHIVRRSAELRGGWRDCGAEPGDTFVAFDGSLHLFPRLSACIHQEMPSFNGDDVFDALVIDGSAGLLRQLVDATLPAPVFSVSVGEARAILRSTSPAALRWGPQLLARALEELAATRSVVQSFLAGPPPVGDAVPVLAALVQRHFPSACARHRQVYGSLGLDLAGGGLAREAKVLASLRTPIPWLEVGDAWSTYRSELLEKLDASDVPVAVEVGESGLDGSDTRARGSWWSRVWSRLRAGK